MDLIGFLQSLAEDPWAYGTVFLLYTIATTVILPIPEEIGLLNPYIPWYWLVLVLGIGKTIGAALVYPLGGRIEKEVRAWTARWPWLARWYDWVEKGVGRYGYWALFGLLAVPFMTDTAPVYAFTILNPQDDDKRRLRFVPFLIVNLAAGLTRGVLFLVVPLELGWS